MLNQSVSPKVSHPTPVGHVFPPIFSSWAATSRHRPAAIHDRAALEQMLDDTEAPVEWSEEDIVFLHWRLLEEVSHLADPATPLEEKFDTLRWVFSERRKGRPAVLLRQLPARCRLQPPVAHCLLRIGRRRGNPQPDPPQPQSLVHRLA
jgi:hypothetical protein